MKNYTILKSRDFFGAFLQTVLFDVKKNQSCLAGYKQFFLNYDGCVYLCSWGCGDTKYKLGENSSVEEKEIQRYQHMTVNDNGKCRNCNVKYICGGECHIIKGNNENLDAWCELKRYLIGLAIYIVDWMNNNDKAGKKILMDSISQNMYCDRIEDYIKVIMDIFKQHDIRKGANYIKNEINCVDNGPEYREFVKYLEKYGLKVKNYQNSQNDVKTIYILYERCSGYNSYKRISRGQITKRNEKNIICID